MNTIITPNWVSTDTALKFKNSVRLIGQFDRQWESMWRDLPDGAKIGYTAQVRIQQRDQVAEGQALQVTPLLNATVPLTINHQFQVAHSWSSADDKIAVEEVRERYDGPAGSRMAEKWDVVAGQEVYRQISTQIGSPGVPLSSDQLWLDGVAKLHNFAVPPDFTAVIDPKTQSRILGANLGSFNPQAQISKYYKTGQFNEGALGVEEWMMDQVGVPTHVTGTFTSSTPLVNGASQTGSTLVTSGWGTYSFKAGDTFYVTGVNSLNPGSYTDTGDLMAFSLQSDLAGSGAATFTISPPIIPNGPGNTLATVTASPANNASILFVGSTGVVNATMAAQSSKQSLLFNPAAFAFVMADLPVNLPGARAGRTSEAVGSTDKLSFRYVDQYNIQTDQLPRRLDSIGGVAVILPSYALRAWS